MAKAREIPGLSCEQPYGDGAALIVDVRTAELAEHSVGVLDTSDIERLHNMRVATRRLRAALEVFEPCFPRKPFRAALREVKALANALGERRDRDVAIASLRSFEATIAAPDRPGVSSLIDHLTTEQREANEVLAEHVSGGRFEALLIDLRELVAKAYAPSRAPASAPPEAREPSPPALDSFSSPGAAGKPGGDRRRSSLSPTPLAVPGRAARAAPPGGLGGLAEHLRSHAEGQSESAEPTDGPDAEPT